MSRFSRVGVVGHITPSASIVLPYDSKVVPFARFCSWHNAYMSPRDEAMAKAGAKVTHGMCDRCAENWAATDRGPEVA